MADWSGVIAIEGELTGDGRLMEPGALYWDDASITLLWDRTDGDHSGMVVGTVTRIWRDGDRIMAEGDLSASDDEQTRAAVGRVRELLVEGAVGVSVALDDVTAEIRVPADLVATVF
jgi:hypothetical protein